MDRVTYGDTALLRIYQNDIRTVLFMVHNGTEFPRYWDGGGCEKGGTALTGVEKNIFLRTLRAI